VQTCALPICPPYYARLAKSVWGGYNELVVSSHHHDARKLVMARNNAQDTRAVAAEMLMFRRRNGISTAAAGQVLGISGEGYRLKERAGSATGPELAALAEAFGETLGTAFPSYRPTPHERALARHLAEAA